jgi:hypothetical protein
MIKPFSDIFDRKRSAGKGRVNAPFHMADKDAASS